MGGRCRRGHGSFEGRQCRVCKAAWEKARRPRRGDAVNQQRAARRAQAYKFGRLPNEGKPVALGKRHLSLAMDRSCQTCGCPTAFGICPMCLKGFVFHRRG